MITYSELISVHPRKWKDAADDWAALAKYALNAASDVREQGGKPLADNWADEVGAAAAGDFVKLANQLESAYEGAVARPARLGPPPAPRPLPAPRRHPGRSQHSEKPAASTRTASTPPWQTPSAEGPSGPDLRTLRRATCHHLPVAIREQGRRGAVPLRRRRDCRGPGRWHQRHRGWAPTQKHGGAPAHWPVPRVSLSGCAHQGGRARGDQAIHRRLHRAVQGVGSRRAAA